jgi:hypothetical protein
VPLVLAARVRHCPFAFAQGRLPEQADPRDRAVRAGSTTDIIARAIADKMSARPWPDCW